jgi:hypothetical protein
LGELSNNVLFALHHLSNVDAYFLKLQPVTFSMMLSETHMIRGNEKCLARDAPDIKAGTAKHFAVVNYRGVQTELGRSNCAGVSSRATAKNDQIERRHAAMVYRKKVAIKVAARRKCN